MRLRSFVILSVLMSSAPLAAQGKPPAPINIDSLKWSGRPDGIQLANVEGDPMVPDKPYSVALRIANGRWIPPHWHPREQHVIVLAGTLRLGGGERLDSTAVHEIPMGGVGIIPAEARHYEGARGRTTVMLYGIGPMTTTFVTPPAAKP